MLSFLLLAAFAAPFTAGQQQFGVGGNGQVQRPEVPLHDLTMQVFDKDKDGAVTLAELTSTVDGLLEMASMGQEPGDAKGKSSAELMAVAVKSAAPHLFAMLDGDESGGLDKTELGVLEKINKGLKSGALKNMTREVFGAIDADSDNTLSEAELLACEQPDMIARLVAIVTAELPLPALLSLAKAAAKGDKGAATIKAGLAMLDDDGNGVIERTEAGKAYGAFKRMYIKAVEMMQKMGPMMALFGGGGADGGLESLMAGLGGAGGGRGGRGGGMGGMGGMGGFGGMGGGGMGGMGGMGGGRDRGKKSGTGFSGGFPGVGGFDLGPIGGGPGTGNPRGGRKK